MLLPLQFVYFLPAVCDDQGSGWALLSLIGLYGNDFEDGIPLG